MPSHSHAPSRETPPTPYLAVDVDRLDSNLTAMAETARQRGVALRPHAKTHKTPAIADLQLGLGAVGLTVATVSEAEVFAAAGVEDLFIAYPLWVTAGQATRLAALLDRALLRVAVDTVDGLRALADHLGPRPGLELVVEVDSGQHRTGVSPEEAGALARSASDLGFDVAGVFTFPGHSYRPGAPGDVARAEAETLARARDSLTEHGVDARVVSGGSTPTVGHGQSGWMNEMRPGVYLFGDAQQWELGTIGPEQVALTCHATVVSTAGGRVVLDSGSKVIGADRAVWATGHGRLLDHPEARLTQLSEHHAVVGWDTTPLPSVGDRLRVVPNHVCNAVNLVDVLHVEHSGTLVDRWRVTARGANT